MQNMNDLEVSSDTDTDFDLDTSWIREQEKVQNMDKKMIKEPMQKVAIFFIYLDKNNSIDKILKDIIDLQIMGVGMGSMISKDNVLRIIQSKKIYTPTSKYRFKEILQFTIPIDSEYIQSFAYGKEDKNNDFLKVLQVPYNDIFFPESVFIFHKTNSLFFLYQETDNCARRHTFKSILKKGHGDGSGGRRATTKKVKIKENMFANDE
jgi:hypothetical protein